MLVNSALVLPTTFVLDRSRGEMKQQNIFHDTGLMVLGDNELRTGVLDKDDCLLPPCSGLLWVSQNGSACAHCSWHLHSGAFHLCSTQTDPGEREGLGERPGLMTRGHMIQMITGVTT